MLIRPHIQNINPINRKSKPQFMRTNKHKTKRELEVMPCISLKNAQSYIDLIENRCKEVIIIFQEIKEPIEPGESISVDQLKHLINTRIDMDPSTNLQGAMKLLQTTNEEFGISSSITLCSMCVKKIGVKKCSGCSKTSQIRYCSKECQVAAWPSHKGGCGL